MAEVEEGNEEVEEQEYAPNIRPAHTGLLCPFDMQRPCGSDCAAYVTHPRRSSSSELNEQSSHCALISGVERLGRNLTIIAQGLVKAEKNRQVSEADRKRQGQFVPDLAGGMKSPFGGKKDE